MNQVITPEMYWMERNDQYPDEWTDEVKSNCDKLLKQVNSLLNDLGITEVEISSGWRPAAINASTPNSAKKSLHMIGLAVDIKDDKDQTMGKLVASRPDLLKKYNLWIENLDSTKGKNTNWVHLDLGQRSDRPSRMFIP